MVMKAPESLMKYHNEMVMKAPESLMIYHNEMVIKVRESRGVRLAPHSEYFTQG